MPIRNRKEIPIQRSALGCCLGCPAKLSSRTCAITRKINQRIWCKPGMNQVAWSPLKKRQYEAPAKFVREMKLNLYWHTVMQPVCRNLLGITNFYIAVAGCPSSAWHWVITRSLAAVLPITQVILDCNKQVTASR